MNINSDYSEQVKLFGAQNVNNLLELGRISDLERLLVKIRLWWDELYPENIFTGESGDEGPLKVKEIRDILNSIKKDEEVILEFRRTYLNKK